LRLWGVSVSSWNPNGALRTMNRVFSGLGYRMVNASEGENWDLLWSVEYPFAKGHIHAKTKLFEPLFKINYKFLPHQRINHIPGFQVITNKLNLGIKTDSKYLMSTFIFPDMLEKFEEFKLSHPKAKFVEKNYNNRGVKLVEFDEIQYNQSLKIYQHFMDNPYLIDGHAFDFGVYVLITSINPLRIYRYSHENYIRFCPEEYHPFDAKNTKKYVVDGGHFGAYEMPSFEEMYDDYGYSFKMIFEDIIKEQGFDVEKFWRRIDDAIVDVVNQNEQRIVGKVSLKSLRGLSELKRINSLLP
jgi:tubulin monoglycylase TTLL15